MSACTMRWPASWDDELASVPWEYPDPSLQSYDVKKPPYVPYRLPGGPCGTFSTNENDCRSLASSLSGLVDDLDHRVAGTYPPNTWGLNRVIATSLFHSHVHPALDHPDRPPSFANRCLPRLKRAREELFKRGQNEREWGDQLWRLNDIIRRLENVPTGRVPHLSRL